MSDQAQASAPPLISSDDPGRGQMILAVTWLLTSTCICVLVGRFYVRMRVRSIGLDDWLMLPAVILQIAFQACVTKGYTYGLGKHDANLSFDQLVSILKWMWISTTPAILESTIARISITVFLIRIFGVHAWLKWFLIIFTVLQTIGGSLIIIFVWAQVSPVQGLWNPLLPARRWDKNIQSYAAYLGQSMFTFSDLTYVLFPVIIISNLNMPFRRKVGLVILMALSLFTMVASIMKTVTSQSNALDTNAQYKASVSVLWSAVEQSFVIIMGCIPPLCAIMKLEFPLLRSIGTSLASLVARRSDHIGASSAYGDIELEARKRGLHRDFSKASDIQICRKESSHGTNDTRTIRRADVYTVSYENQAERKTMV